ncbi:MAG: UvrD-helicase domain-containing protein [Erysipelotrichaceae bacterium]|nr:UvrD-helicase domain-containing protein [Erysipelotrichaceae bacterium]
MCMLNNLNSNQKKAVVTDSRYVRIIAGAGSGKTRVLTSRIAWLIKNRKAFPNQILAITFTNKAANEMKERVSRMMEESGSMVWISTIHSLCVRILREDIHCMGMPRNFTVMDADDQKAILKEAYKELGFDKTSLSFSSALDYISANKGEEITVERAYLLAGQLPGEKRKAQVYEYYIKRQNALYALDFDDLLLVTVRMFRQFAEVLDKWQKRFTHIHVDEFQDIDKIQYELIRHLAGLRNDVYVVGDPDQTIYTWRGADVNIIMNFERDFEPCETIILNENYRSTPQILQGANSLIVNNRYRVEKELFTSNPDSGKITHYSSASDEYEARWIASKMSELHKNGKPWRDMAVLYRSNYLSRAIEKGLLDEHIPYIIFGGVKFYERAEIKDALCYLRMICAADDLALMRILNKPKRGLGNKSIETILKQAQKEGISMYEAMKNHRLFSGKNQKTIDEFVSMIERWRKKAEEGTEIFKLLELVIDESGYRSMLEEDKEIERLENLKELIGDVQSFTVNYPESTLEEYLQLVSLYGDKSELETGQAVQLMTVHASKGLEFDTVFLCGMNDGVFPSERSMQDGLKGLEEERRLAYVAMTRAKRKLYITEPGGFSYILQRPRMKSRFIDEIDESTMEHIGATFDYGRPKEFKISLPEDDFEPIRLERPMEKKTRSGLKGNDIVIHGVFGEGIVLSVKVGLAEIAFPFPHGIKKILATHPSLKKKNS